MPEIIKCEFCGNPRPETVSVCPYCKPTKQQIINSKIHKTAEAVAKGMEERKERQERETMAKTVSAMNLPEATPMATIKTKHEFVGPGCLVQGIGLILLFLFPIGTIAGIGLLVYGNTMAKRFICGKCGNKIESKDVKICPVCKELLG